jgi:hypothetical protein
MGLYRTQPSDEEVPPRILRWRRAANQSISDATETSVCFDTEDEDVGFDLTAGSGGVTIPDDGIYAVSYGIIAAAGTDPGTWSASSPPGRILAYVDITSTLTGQIPSIRQTGLGEERASLNWVGPFLDGDSVLARIYQDNASNVAVNFTAYLTVVRLGLYVP